jgi:chromosome segregation ATPase
MKKTAGNLFVKFLGFGVFVLICIIFGSKSFTPSSASSTLFLAGAIFAINIFVVVGYSLAVIRTDEILLEEDAPDLAYYLGFSLTVASLAFSFISDVGMASNAAASSALVKGSLAQFGSGLLATLIGLCAKIFITSKQAHLASNPEILYQEFRMEIREFENALSAMATSLDSSIKTACLSMTASAESAADSMDKLSARLQASSDSIAEHLTVEKIAHPIAAFSEELLKLQDPAQEFRTEMSTLAGSASAITKGFVNLETSISEVRLSTLAEIKNIDGLIETKKQLNEASKQSLNLLLEQNTTATEANKQLIKLKNSSLKTSEGLELVSASSASLFNRSGELEEGLAMVNRSVLETSQRLAELIVLTKDFGSSLKAGSDNAELLSARSTAANTALADTSNALSEINAKIVGVPDTLDRTLSSLNNLTNSLAATANSTEPLIRSLSSVNAPLVDTSESAKSLHVAIAKLNQEVESLSRIISKTSN